MCKSRFSVRKDTEGDKGVRQLLHPITCVPTCRGRILAQLLAVDCHPHVIPKLWRRQAQQLISGNKW